MPAGPLDVTERKRTEEKLRASEERFRQVAENVADFIWEVDGRAFSVTRVRRSKRFLATGLTSCREEAFL